MSCERSLRERQTGLRPSVRCRCCGHEQQAAGRSGSCAHREGGAVESDGLAGLQGGEIHRAGSAVEDHIDAGRDLEIPGGRGGHRQVLVAEGIAVSPDLTVDIEKLIWSEIQHSNENEYDGNANRY